MKEGRGEEFDIKNQVVQEKASQVTGFALQSTAEIAQAEIIEEVSAIPPIK